MKKLLWLVLFVVMLRASPLLATVRYAGPAGSGTTCSAGSPCSLAYLWTVTVAGDTILLNDGHYTGSTYMLTPTAGLSGTASLPITVSAVNDGEAWFDGQGVRLPCYLYQSNYWVMNGFNCSDSSLEAFKLSYSNHNIVRRVVAWDASSSANSHVWAVNYASSENLIEDSAGFGTGRKTFTHFGGAGATTLRRFWGHWWFTTRTDPKMTLSPFYNSYGFTCENCVFSMDEQAGSDTYQRFGIVSGDRIDSPMTPPYDEPSRKVNNKILGSIVFQKNGWGSGGSSYGAVHIQKVGNFEIKDTVVYLESDFSAKRPFYILNCKLFSDSSAPDCAVGSLSITNASAIGGATSTFGSQWAQTNVKTGANVAAVYTSGTLWKHSGSLGATICKRYENRVLTETPLFESDGTWPMNQRIIDAMTDAGYTPINLTTTLTGIFGAIDADCKAGGSPSASITLTYPDAGGNFTSGTTVSIAWQSQGITGNVDVKVSRDGGSTKTTLATVAYNTSPYLWTVVTPKSANVKFYVEQGATIGASTTAGSIKGRLTGIKP